MALSASDLEDTEPLSKVVSESLERTRSLVESISKIPLASTAWQVASECAVALRKTLDARGAIIHQHDQRKRELRIIGVAGPNAEDLLGSVDSTDDDFVATTVLSNGRTMTMRVDGELPRFAPQRLRALGASRSIVAVPILSGATCVAIVELVDVDDQLEQIITSVSGVLSEQLLRVLSPAA